MPCEKCQLKLRKSVVPTVLKSADIKAAGGKAPKTGSKAVLGGKNVLLTKKDRFVPGERVCKICKQKVGTEAHYCTACAYQKGICSMCGKKVLDTTNYVMTGK